MSAYEFLVPILLLLITFSLQDIAKRLYRIEKKLDVMKENSRRLHPDELRYLCRKVKAMFSEENFFVSSACNSLSGDYLDQRGVLVGVTRRPGESDDEYRPRVVEAWRKYCDSNPCEKKETPNEK